MASSSMTEWDQVTELNQLEQFLRQPDAVMEPNIMEKLRQYVAKGGSPRDLVEMLTDSYVGYAQMASMVVDWMHNLDEIDPNPQRDKTPIDEAYFLRELAKQKFDPSKFSGVFTRGGGGPPKWLDGLASDKQGRQLIYELSANHHNCLLLNYAIQKILSKGHEDEVASVGSSLASYFGVFHRLLINRLREVPNASVHRLRQLSTELKDTCCQGHHTYMYAQLLLTHLSRNPKGLRFKRLSQELEQYASSKRGPVVWRMMPLFLPAHVLNGNEECARMATELLCIGPSAVVNPGVVPLVTALDNLYSQDSPPPVEIIRHPRICDMLTSALFSPDNALPEDHRIKFSSLLAFATSAEDSRPEGSLNLENVQPVIGALRDGSRLTSLAASGERLSIADMSVAEEISKWPVVAQGVLIAMRARLTSVDYWMSTDRGSAASSFLQLLAVIIPKHQSLHSQSVDVIGGALRTMGNAQPELARCFIEMAVLLLQVGQVMRVMKFAERWAASADPSLVRHFIFTLLEASCAPYSSDFAASLIRLMQHAGVKWSRQQQRTLQDIERLEQFAAACKDIKFSPPLGSKETKYLEDLQSEKPF